MLAVHQPGHLAARIDPPAYGLHVVVQTPIEFALQHEVEGGGQLLDDAGNLARRGRPVVAHGPIASADDLAQAPVAIHQAHRDTIHLGLNPDILACAQPGANGLFIQEFFQAGMGHGVRQGPA